MAEQDPILRLTRRWKILQSKVNGSLFSPDGQSRENWPFDSIAEIHAIADQIAPLSSELAREIRQDADRLSRMAQRWLDLWWPG